MKSKWFGALIGMVVVIAIAGVSVFFMSRMERWWYSSPTALRSGTGTYAWSDIFDGIPSSEAPRRYDREIAIKRGEDGNSLVFELAPVPFPYPSGDPYDATIVRATGSAVRLPTGAEIRLRGVRRRFATGEKEPGVFKTERRWLDPLSGQLLDQGDDRLEAIALGRGGESGITGGAVNHAWFGALIDAEGDPDLRWIDLKVLDPLTHFEAGYLGPATTFPPAAFLDVEFRRYHPGRLLLVFTCVTGPTTTHRVPLEPGSVTAIGFGNVKIHHVLRERWTKVEFNGHREFELSEPRPEEKGTVGCLSFSPGILGSQLRLLGAEGGGTEFTDRDREFEVLALAGEPDELTFEFRPRVYHIVFEVDTGPLFAGARPPENLFDVRVPYLKAENPFYLRWAIHYGVQLELDGGGLSSTLEAPREYRDMTFAEILKDHAGAQPVRVDPDAGTIEIGFETWMDRLREWLRMQRNRWK